MSQETLSRAFLAEDSSEYLQGEPNVAGLVHFPGKSMSPHFLPEAFVSETGLRPSEFSPNGDRQFMMTDAKGKMESQRSIPTMARMDIIATDREGQLVFDGDSIVFKIPTNPETKAKVHTTDGIAVVDMGNDVAGWLTGKFGKPLRLVRQVDERPRMRDEVLRIPRGINHLLALQDSSSMTSLSHSSLKVLNDRLADFDWYMEALSMRMNILLAGNINEHAAVDKFLQVGPVERAVYFYVWRPKERCTMPAVDPMRGVVRGNDGTPRERMSFIYQEILKSEAVHVALEIPLSWRFKENQGNLGAPKAMLGVDMVPVNQGIVKVGDTVTIVDSVPDEVWQSI